MRSSLLSRSVLPAALAILLVGCLGVPSVRALTISPVRLEVTVDPGGSYSGEVILKNDQDVQKTFYPTFENFEARGESGLPYFIPGKEGLAGWIEGPSEVLLAPGERRTVLFRITVPSDAKPGGYFAAILWNDTPPAPTQGGQVAIGAKVGSLVLLRVAGDIPEAGGVTSFATQDGTKVFNSLPITFVWRFQNSGGDRVKPEGKVRIVNTLGSLAAELPANASKGNILPGSTRKFEVAWGEDATGSGSTVGMGFFAAAREQARHWRMGRYRADLALIYDQGGEKVTSFVFYVLPWQLLGILAGGLILVLLVVRVLLVGYKRRIIAAAQMSASSPTSAPRPPRNAKMAKAAVKKSRG